MEKTVTSGVIFTDGTHYLLCHPTKSKWWDIPKGKQDPGETFVETAIREVQEETGLNISESELWFLGHFAYTPAKTLVLYKVIVDSMPEPSSLSCQSRFKTDSGWTVEMDAYKVVDRDAFVTSLSPRLAKIVETLV